MNNSGPNFLLGNDFLAQKSLEGGVSGSNFNFIPVVLFPVLVGLGIFFMPESDEWSIDPDLLSVPAIIVLFILMRAWAIATIRRAQANPDNYR